MRMHVKTSGAWLVVETEMLPSMNIEQRRKRQTELIKSAIFSHQNLIISG